LSKILAKITQKAKSGRKGKMPKASTITTFVFWVVMALLYFAPGGVSPLERPKKGFWQARDILWPFRKFRSQLPSNAQLSKAYGGSLVWALFVSSISALAIKFIPTAAKTISPVWLMVECAVVSIFVGRAWGFWSADRKLQKTQAAEERLER
jgi:hypothetical protein